MGEPAAQKRGIGRWIFLGCAGCGGLVLLSFAGCAGLMYYLYKGTDPIAAVGAEYLKKAPEVTESLGTPLTIARKPLEWKVQLHKVQLHMEQGNARIGYSLKGPKGGAEAVVWLAKIAGTWTAIGAKVGPSLEIGNVPRARLRDSLDWDD
ncbi:MAG TPA: hypothetical protein VF950_12905 [Planctomycetota bacterium]